MTDIDALDAAIDTLSSVAPPERRDAVIALRDRVRERRLRVLVAGEAKRGKSTVLNRILGRDILPTGVLPLTAIATTVRVDRAAKEHIVVHFLDGRVERHGLDALPSFVTETDNPGNNRNVAEVLVALSDAEQGVDRVDLIDTPGTGSVFTHNTEAARRAYGGLDAVLVVLGANPPISASEVDLLTEVASLAVRIFVLVNKTDQLTAEELTQTVEFTQRIVDDAAVNVPVWPVSARMFDRGLTNFLAAFQNYVRTDSDDDLLHALARHAARLITQLQDETSLELAVLRSNSAEHRDQIRLFAERIEALTEQTATLHDSVDVALRRVVRALTADASLLAPEVVARAKDIAARAYDAAGERARVERAAVSRGRAVEATVTAVESWREAQAVALQGALQRLADDLNGDVERQIAELRSDAETMLAIALTLPFDGVELLSNRRFWYATDPPMSWDLPGAQLARHSGPGADRRTRRRLIDDVGRMADQQVGRARSDLQARVTDSVRQLKRQLTTKHADLLAQLRRVLAVGEEFASRNTRDASAQLEVLLARQAALASARADLPGHSGR